MKKVQGKNHQQTGFHSHFPKMPKVRPQHIHLLSCSFEDIAAQSLETNFKAQKSHKMCYRESLCMCQIHYNMRNMHTNTHYKNILPPQIPPRVLNWPQRFLCIHSEAIWPQLKKRKKKKSFDTNSKLPSAEISQTSLRLSELRLFTDKSSQLQQKLQILQSLKDKWKQPIVWPILKRNCKIKNTSAEKPQRKNTKRSS